MGQQNARDAESFEDFAAARLPALLRYAVVLTGDRHLAQDIVQEVMIRAHAKWRRIGVTEWPDRYVRRMVTREFLSWRRRWSVRAITPTEDAVIEAARGPAPDHSDATDDRDDLWHRLARLPRQQRAVLVLRYYEGLTDVEIASVLGCAAGSVRGYASRGLSTLRAALTACAVSGDQR